MIRASGMRTVLIIILLVSLYSPAAQVADHPDEKRVEFGSAGMDLHLDELMQIDGVVWALDFIDADTLIFTLRRGDVGLLDLATREVRLLDGAPVVLRVVGGGPFDQVASGGLFDILVDPEFEENRSIYLAYVKPIGDGHTLAVAKARLQGDQLIDVEDIFVANNVSDAAGRWGSRLAMDQDRYLFVAVGDHRIEDSAQDLSSHGGKLVRLYDDGRIPADNPFVNDGDAAPEVWSYGHRNPQGLAFHPQTGELFEQEHGPDGGDEINRIEKGKNYGWPIITYGVSREGKPVGIGTEQPGMEQPVKYYKPGVGPSGMMFYFGDRYPGWAGSLFNGSLSRMHLNRLEFKAGEVVDEERLLEDWRERIRDVAQGPDGLLYLSTDSGKIVRIVPK
jgi:glucose/arabinose dehydrogenase